MNVLKKLILMLFILTLINANSQCNQYQIYESFTNTLTTQGGTWAVNSISASTSPTRTGSYALGFNANGDWIRTPLIANPGVLSFWHRRNTITTAWTLNVQTSPNGTTWTTRGSVTSSTLTYQQYTLNIGALGLTNVYIRLIDARTSGTPLRYVDDLSITSTVSTENTLIPLLGNCSQTLSSALTYTITDTGGPTDTYNNNLDQTVTLSPSDNTKKLQLNFTAFDLESGWDFLYIYDGPNTGSTLLATLDGTTLPPSVIAQNATGQLTLRFTSDVSTIRAGFSATATSVTPCTIPTIPGTLSSDKATTVVNDAVTFSVSGNEGSVTLFEWSFDNFTNIAGSTSNPIMPFSLQLNISQTNVYFRATSVNGSCPAGITSPILVNLELAPPYIYGVSDGDYITNVTLNDINNTSTEDGDAYSNFTSIVGNLDRGANYTINVSSTETFGSYSGYAAWIDWNQDGLFQTSENILISAPGAIGSSSFTVPNDVVQGTVKMRVLSVWNATPTNDAYYLTGYDYGEIEEYSITFSIPLPVELIQFFGNCIDNQIELNWLTASENNSDYFEILKSDNGHDWRIINKQNAAGFSLELQSYSFIDIGNNNQSYYRLNQVDFDGKNKLYAPIFVDCYDNENELLTYPNPSKNKFNIIIKSSELISDSKLIVRDLTGKIILNNTISVNDGINLFEIELGEINHGIYFISVENNKINTNTIKHLVD